MRTQRQWCPVRCGHHLRAPFIGLWTHPLLVHRRWIPTRLRTTTTPPNAASIASSTKWRVRGTLHLCEPSKQPLAKPVIPWRSRRLAAQPLSRVPASKRGEVLIMQRMGYTRGLSAPSASELEAFDRLYDGNLTASKARRWMSSSRPLERHRSGSRENARPPRPQSCIDIGCSFYVISKHEAFC